MFPENLLSFNLFVTLFIAITLPNCSLSAISFHAFFFPEIPAFRDPAAYTFIYKSHCSLIFM